MSKPKKLPAQKQSLPGYEHKMNPEPEIIHSTYIGSKKLKGKTALITGGDSGIGRSVAVHFAREGADVAIVYLKENKDAKKTKTLVEKLSAIESSESIDVSFGNAHITKYIRASTGEVLAEINET